MQESYAAAAESVGQESFDALFASGRVLTLEQAVGFALTIYPTA